MALVAGAIPSWTPDNRQESRLALRLGISLGAIGAAARTASAIVASDGPAWPSYAGAGSFVPVLAATTGPVLAMLTRIVFLLLIVAAANRLTAGWTRRRVLGGALLVIVGGMLGAAGSPLNLVPWTASAVGVGALLAAAYVIVLRHDVSVVPIAAAVMTMAGALRDGSMRAYPGALSGTIAGVVVMGCVAYAWFRALRARSEMKAAE